MTSARRTAPRLRLLAGALAVLAPVAPAVTGPDAARIVVGAYALGVTLFVGLWLRRSHERTGVCEHGSHRAAALSEQLDRVSALLEAGRAVNSAHELDNVLQTILHKAVTMAGARTGSVMLADDSSLQVVAAVANDNALGQRLDFGDGIAGRVAMTRGPLLIDGVASAARYPGLVARAARVDSAMSVPMIDRGELVGVLNVGADAAHRFETVDLETLCAFAEHAAAAIAKARLYDASQRVTRELAHRATHDSLTGLPNRTLLRDRVTDAVDQPEPRGALLFVDLDGFKAVNDSCGHSAGDWLLTVVAERVRDACPPDGVAARVGGDEFAVFLADATVAADAVAVARSVLDVVRRPIPFEGQSVAISASVGIALAGVHGHNYSDLMEAADAALYDAKSAGKNCWHIADVAPAATDGPQLPRPRRAPASPARGEHVTH